MLRNCIRLHNRRLYICLPKASTRISGCYCPVLVQPSDKFAPQRRHFSFQESVNSLIRTQSGIFRTLSESTPVEYAQKFLLTLHDASGLPWWATIVCTTILLRASITLPLAIYQQYILAKLENLRLELPAIAEELRRETSIAVKMYNWDEETARRAFSRSMRKQWAHLVVRENCHPIKASLLLWFQIPMWISLSIALRNLVYMLPKGDIAARLTFTELTVGGFSFIPNLTEIDASLILPVSLGLLNLAIIEFQVASRSRDPSKTHKVFTNIFRGLSLLMIPISASVPSCLTLYWTSSSLFGLLQNVALASPKVKRFCGIPKTSSELQDPYKQVVEKLRKKFKSTWKLK